MKKTMTAGLVLAGILAVSGTSFATPKTVAMAAKDSAPTKSQLQSQKPPMPPEGFDSKRPPMSRDKKPPMPQDGKRPMMSRDKRPPMPPRSMDRRPPEFSRPQPKQQGVESKW